MTNAIQIGKKAFTWSVVVLTILWSMGIAALVPLAAQAQTSSCPTLKAGDLFKVPNLSAVYLLNANLQRLYFPHSDVYHSWYADFSGVVEIPARCVDAYPAPSSAPFGVNYRPGSKMVKVQISPSVYAVLPGNKIAKVNSESVAAALYGSNWNKQIADIADVFWPNYAARGADITEAKPHDGMLVKTTGSNLIYYVNGGQRYLIDGNISQADIQTVDIAILNAVPKADNSITSASVYGNPAQDGAVISQRQFNIKEYGARGDGRTEDTDAIQSALNAARAAGGGTVFIPDGTYIVYPQSGSAFTVGSNTTVQGQGGRSILKVGDGVSNYNYLFGQGNPDPRLSLSHVENISFRDFWVDQNPYGNAETVITEESNVQNVIQFHGFKNITIQNMHFDPEIGTQAIVLDGSETDGVNINNNSFRFVRSLRSLQKNEYHDHSSIYTEAKNTVISNNVFQSELKEHAITAIEVHGGPKVTISNNSVDGFPIGINAVNSTEGYPDVKNAEFTIDHNEFQRVSQGVALWSVIGRTLRGVKVTNNTIKMARHEHYADVYLGIYFYTDTGADVRGDFDQINILNNSVDFTGLPSGAVQAAGVDLRAVGKVSNVLVKGNTFTNCPQKAIQGADNPRYENIKIGENREVKQGRLMPVSPFITSPVTANGTVNQPFSYQISATNNPTGYDAINLPAGLSIKIYFIYA